ncbi:MAG TPA: adenylate/guanylate cyclase domain-containing protein [Stellaceae bacterium]|nr:adenylate/guanylate cyclase domain-containing protein [Stellaceae bacterium]
MREAGLGLVVGLGVLLVLGHFENWSVLRGLETASLDLRFRLRGVTTPGPEVAVVLVDDHSLARLGRWPLSRRVFAKAVQLLDRDGARVIAFDLLFTEPELAISRALRSAAKAAAGRLSATQDPGLRQALTQLAADDPDGDFAAALRNSGRVLLPVAFSFQGPEEASPPELADQVFQQLDQSRNAPLFPLQPHEAVLPIPVLAGAASGIGHVLLAFDRDGAPRYDYLALPFGGDFVASLPVRAAAAYLGLKWNQVGLALGDGVRLGDSFIPSDRAMRLLINYRGPRGTIPTYSFVDLVEGRVPPERLKGRIVLIGASFIGAADAYPGPFDNTPISGTERLADATDTILAHDFIRENPPPWPLVVIGLVAALAVATGVAAALLPTRLASVGGTVPLVGWAAGAQIAFQHGLWLPLVSPVAALAAAAAAVLLFRYGFVDRERRFIQTAFRHFLAPDLVNTLAAHPERLQLGGETRMLTIMFSDIRGFTAISESFKANPQGLSRLINRGFLSPMTRLIMARRGTIDKYMGDCVMAFWNAPLDDPDHADNACATALAMLAELDRINRELMAEAEAEARPFRPIHIGVGINTGECVVGNMGSDERFAYTAMGDAVNLASRLEGQSKTYGLSIVIGEATRAAAPGWAALELDLIAVQGKEEAVRIYTLLGDPAFAQTPQFRALSQHHAAMLARYRGRDWPGARAALARCRGCDRRLDPLYDLYAERVDYFAANPPSADWDGVFVAPTK